jgi:pimeloyl-ACP methyl ester carboxylesterase
LVFSVGPVGTTVTAVGHLYADVDPKLVDDLDRVRQGRQIHIDTDAGAAWEYVDLGDGPTTLFLHGMAGGYDIWFQQVLALGTHRRVLAVTYPPIPSLEPLAKQLMGLLDSIEVEKVSVVGSSLGGYIAQYLVANHPDRIERAVFANTFPPNEQLAREHSGRLRLAKVAPARVVMKQLSKSVDDAIVPAAGGSALVRAYLLEQAAGGMTKSQFLARFACVLDSFEAPDPDSKPLMLIEAKNDPLVSAELRRLLIEAYPGAETVSLDYVGHFPYLNEAERYNTLLEEFLG